MPLVDSELTLTSVFTSWRADPVAIAAALILAAGYLWALYRGRTATAGQARPVGEATATGDATSDGLAAPDVPAVSNGRAATFLLIGAGVVALSGTSMIGVYSDTLFWVRALQVLLLLYVAPFGLAAGMPVSVLEGALGPRHRARLQAVLDRRAARFVTAPATVSIAMLATPWLLYLTPWYHAMLTNAAVDAITRLLLVAVGFCYFYSRIQADPVPRRHTQLVSLAITLVETLGDGVLGIVLWLGPLLNAAYYSQRTWGPSPRIDQSVGAGILWILGDVLGLPFLFVLMRAFTADENRKGALIDAELDAAEEAAAQQAEFSPAADEPAPKLWWEDDPQLAARFRRS